MNKPALRLGEWYAVRVRISGIPKRAWPACEVRKRLQLIDRRSNGVLIMAEDVVVWDWNQAEGDWAAAMRGAIEKWPRRTTRLIKVHRGAVLATWDQWLVVPKKSTRAGLVPA